MKKWAKVFRKGFAGLLACSAVLMLAAGCGGSSSSDTVTPASNNGGAGGGDQGTALLSGSVLYPSANNKVSFKAGADGVVYARMDATTSSDLSPVASAVVQVFAIDDTDFSDPIATVTADANGVYTFTDTQLGAYANKPVVIRAKFESPITPGQYVAVRSLEDLSDENRDTTEQVQTTPFTDAIIEKVVGVFNDFDITLTEDQFAELSSVVKNIVETAEAEIESGTASMTLDETSFGISEDQYTTDAPDTTDRTDVGSSLDSALTDAAVSSFENEMASSDAVDLTDAATRAMSVKKMINFVCSLGACVADGQGNFFVMISPGFVSDHAMPAADQTATELLAAQGFAAAKSFVADAVDAGTDVIDSGDGFADSLIKIDPSVLFDTVDTVTDPSQVTQADQLSLVAEYPDTEDSVAPEVMLRLWEQCEDNDPVFPYNLIKALATVRSAERISFQEVAQVIANNFKWKTESVTKGPDGRPIFGDDVDLSDEDGGSDVTATNILNAMLGTIPATALEYANKMASRDSSLIEMGEDIIHDVIWRAFVGADLQDGTADDNTDFDPEAEIFSKLKSADDVRNFIKGKYSEIEGMSTDLPVSPIYAKMVEKIKKVLIAAIPQDWYGKTLTKDTMLTPRGVFLQIMYNTDRMYLIDTTKGYFRTITEGDQTYVEPRFDNLKWLDVINEETVMKNIFEQLLDGQSPDGTKYKDVTDASQPDLTAYTLVDDATAGLSNLSSTDYMNFQLWQEMYDPNVGMTGFATADISVEVAGPDGGTVVLTTVTIKEIKDPTTGFTAEVGEAVVDAADDNHDYPVFTYEGLQTNRDYVAVIKFENADGDSQQAEFWFYVPEFLPNPDVDEDPAVGDFDFGIWGEPVVDGESGWYDREEKFFLPPVGGFMSFPGFGLPLDDQDPEGNVIGVDLSKFSVGDAFGPDDSTVGRKMDLAFRTQTDGTIALEFRNSATYFDFTELSKGTTGDEAFGWRGLMDLVGVNMQNAITTAGEEITPTNTSLYGSDPLVLDPADFEDPEANTTDVGRLLVMKDGEGQMFVLCLNWMDPDGAFLDICFGKVGQDGMIAAVEGDFGGVPFMTLWSGDYLDLETGAWSPPVDQGYIAENADLADLRYNVDFYVDTAGADHFQGDDTHVISTVSTARIKKITTTQYNSLVDAMAADSTLSLADAITSVIGTLSQSVSVAKDDILLVKTKGDSPGYFLLKVAYVQSYSDSDTTDSMIEEPGHVDFAYLPFDQGIPDTSGFQTPGDDTGMYDDMDGDGLVPGPDPDDGNANIPIQDGNLDGDLDGFPKGVDSDDADDTVGIVDADMDGWPSTVDPDDTDPFNPGGGGTGGSAFFFDISFERFVDVNGAEFTAPDPINAPYAVWVELDGAPQDTATTVVVTKPDGSTLELSATEHLGSYEYVAGFATQTAQTTAFPGGTYMVTVTDPDGNAVTEHATVPDTLVFPNAVANISNNSVALAGQTSAFSATTQVTWEYTGGTNVPVVNAYELYCGGTNTGNTFDWDWEVPSSDLYAWVPSTIPANGTYLFAIGACHFGDRSSSSTYTVLTCATGDTVAIDGPQLSSVKVEDVVKVSASGADTMSASGTQGALDLSGFSAKASKAASGGNETLQAGIPGFTFDSTTGEWTMAGTDVTVTMVFYLASDDSVIMVDVTDTANYGPGQPLEGVAPATDINFQVTLDISKTFTAGYTMDATVQTTKKALTEANTDVNAEFAYTGTDAMISGEFGTITIDSMSLTASQQGATVSGTYTFSITFETDDGGSMTVNGTATFDETGCTGATLTNAADDSTIGTAEIDATTGDLVFTNALTGTTTVIKEAPTAP